VNDKNIIMVPGGFVYVAAGVGLGLGILLGFWVYSLIEGRRSAHKNQKSALQAAERGIIAERSRLHALYNLLSSLTSSLNYQRILDKALDISASVLSDQHAPTDRLVSAVLLFSGSSDAPVELTVGSARRFTPADLRVVLNGTSGFIGKTIDAGAPSFLKNFLDDPELGRVVALRTCNVVFCIPLRAGLHTYGVLLFAHPDAEYFDPVRRETLEIIANQAVIAIQNARLYSDLEQEKERMVEIQEETRKKLARDLHDGPTQSVAAVAMRVNFARRLVDRDPKAAADELFKIEELARKTTKEIRHMLFTLRPLVLESQGLEAALQAMSEKMHETYGQKVVLSIDPTVLPRLEPGRQAVIFFIVEEAVNNARKHAQAANIWIRIKPLEEEYSLIEIEDDGVGFNVGEVDAYYDKRGSLGMVNMRERAELVNGVIHIISSEGQGTRVQLVLPLTEEAAERMRV
jgi:signal transduction histidine kinase